LQHPKKVGEVAAIAGCKNVAAVRYTSEQLVANKGCR